MTTFISRARRAACALLVAGLGASCAPMTVSRIGPPLPPREEKCAVEVLDRGETPSRPYRDVGIVTVESCEDYRSRPCRTWIEQGVCRLGGGIAYVEEYQRPSGPAAPPMRVRAMAAAYVSELRPDPKTDVALRSTVCEPACGAGMRCVNKECVAAATAEDCAAEAELKTPEIAAPATPPEKCTE